jgi:hypothetical protein
MGKVDLDGTTERTGANASESTSRAQLNFIPYLAFSRQHQKLFRFHSIRKHNPNNRVGKLKNAWFGSLWQEPLQLNLPRFFNKPAVFHMEKWPMLCRCVDFPSFAREYPQGYPYSSDTVDLTDDQVDVLLEGPVLSHPARDLRAGMEYGGVIPASELGPDGL